MKFKFVTDVPGKVFLSQVTNVGNPGNPVSHSYQISALKIHDMRGKRKISKSEKDKYYMISLICGI